MFTPITGRSVVVTGGSRGIGRAIVDLLAAEGAEVTFFYRDNTSAAEAVQEPRISDRGFHDGLALAPFLRAVRVQQFIE